MNFEKKKIWITHGYISVIKNGFQGLKVDELCASTGVAKTSFYHYHNSREDFIANLIEWWSSDRWIEVFSSLQAVNLAKTVESFIKHKQKFIDFYCFRIRVMRQFSNQDKSYKIVRKIDQELQILIFHFLEVINDSKDIQDIEASFVYTYLNGWDYLNAFDLFLKKPTMKGSLEELSDFLKSLKVNQSLKQVS